MRRVSRTAALTLAFALLGAAGVPARQARQGASPEQESEVTFKVEINYVEVDAAVFDRDGNFVGDLTADDFEVYEDGVRQEITAFTKVDIPIERVEAKPLPVAATVERDVISNARPFDGRLYVIILDDKHTAALRTPLVKKAAERFITEYMADNDLAAVITTSGQTDATQEFTSNKRLLLRAVDRFVGQKIRSETEARLEEYQRQRAIPRGEDERITRIDDPDDIIRGYDARVTLEALARISEWVGSIRGRRKAIVFFSEGIDYNFYDFLKRESTTVQEKMRDVIATATRSNVSIYSIDPRGLTNLGDESINVSGGFPEDNSLGLNMESFIRSLRMGQDSLRSLAEETGGFAAVDTNDFSTAFERVVKDNSAYYVLGYYPTNDRRDGRFRRIEVRVKRPGVEVRARRGYTAPRGKPPAPPKTPETDKTSPQVREALDSPIALSGMTLSVFAAPFKGADRNADVSVTIEAAGHDFGFERKDGKLVSDLEVSTIAIDAQGRIRGGDRSVVNFALRPENHQRFVQGGVRVSTRLAVPPGRYQLRVAARESGTGRVGSVNYDLDVPDFSKEKLAVSGIVIASASGTVISTVKHDEELRAVLPAPPAASRVFPQGDELAVYAEVYDNEVRTPHVVDITTKVLSEDGRTVFNASAERSSSELQGKPGGYGHQARIPLKDFAPGIYLLTVEAQSRAGNLPPVSRTIQFEVR
ncbi:MAG TPA: VWA domain-containing protein [Vicinamibacterales bacterium]